MALTIALIVLGVWVLHRFLPALAWAAVLAIALWPLHRRLTLLLPGNPRRQGTAAALLLTLLIGLIFTVPFIYVALEGARELRIAVHFMAEAQRSGIPVPDGLAQLPAVGHALEDWWRANLSDPDCRPGAARALQSALGSRIGQALRWGNHPPADHLRLHPADAVFPVSRRRAISSDRLLRLSDRLLGPDGERIGRHMVQAVLATVNGLVLVGLGEGALMGIAYLVAGLPHPVSSAALTGVLAVIPFGAPLAFGVAALYLAAIGSAVAGIAVFCFGLVVVFVADHAVRPVIIGGAARLPFLWVLLGILGGLESFGIIGLFLGPAIMAALISLWRDWTEASVGTAPEQALRNGVT